VLWLSSFFILFEYFKSDNALVNTYIYPLSLLQLPVWIIIYLFVEAFSGGIKEKVKYFGFFGVPIFCLFASGVTYYPLFLFINFIIKNTY